MKKYIDVEEFKRELIDCRNFYPAIVKNALESVPAADVVEVKYGKWIYNPETINLKSGYTCSICKHPTWHSPDVPQAFMYCPNCGAKMDLE